MDKKYIVTFFSFKAEVEAEDENEAEVIARDLLHQGELEIEVKSIKKLK